MEIFKANYKGTNENLMCELCNLHVDSQSEAINCPKTKLEEDDDEENSSKYNNLFKVQQT